MVSSRTGRQAHSRSLVVSPSYKAEFESDMIAHRLPRLACHVHKIGLAVDALHPAIATIPSALVLSNWQKASYFTEHGRVRYPR